jgi:hypothetical protein
MSILETFYILFKSDAKDVKQSAKEAESSTKQLENALQSADKATQQVGKAFKSMIGTASTALAGIFAIGAVSASVLRAAADADALNKTAEALDVNIESLHAWGEAVARSGGSSEGFQNTLRSLSADFMTLATNSTSKTLPFFQKLGVDMLDANGKVRNVMDVLPELAEQFETLSKTESTGLGQKMGLDQGTITLLQQGRRAVEDQIRRQKELGVVTKENAEIAAKFNDQLDDMGQLFRAMYTRIMTTIMPALTWVLQKFEATFLYLKEHQDLVVGFFTVVAGVLTTLYLPAVLRAAAVTLALVAPYLLIGAAIAAVAALFALAAEDVMAFLEGNDSAIGEWTKSWPIIGDIVRGLVYLFEWLATAANAVLQLLLDILNPFVSMDEAFARLSKTLDAAFSKVIDKLPWLKKMIGGVGDAFGVVGGIIKTTWDGIGEAIESVIGVASHGLKIISGTLGQVKSFFGIGDSTSGDSARGAAASVDQANVIAGKQALAVTSTPLSAQTSNSITHANRNVNRNMSVQTGPITINAKEANGDAVNQALSRGLGQELSSTLNHFDDGVAA